MVTAEMSVVFNTPCTVKALFRSAVSELLKVGIESPHHDVEILLAEAIGTTVSNLHFNSLLEVSKEAKEDFKKFLCRRKRREPVPQIIGKWEFYGYEILVNKLVLTPRPSTESLVESVLAVARQIAGCRGQDLVIHDIGTGSGAIAVALGKELPGARVYGFDVSLAAVDIASENVSLHNLDKSVDISLADLQPPRSLEPDLVVANLPYIASDDLSSLAPEVRDYEPSIALDGGTDGLDLIRRLILEIRIVEEGVLFLELGNNQFEMLKSFVLREIPFLRVEAKKDFDGINRVMIISGWRNNHV